MGLGTQGLGGVSGSAPASSPVFNVPAGSSAMFGWINVTEFSGVTTLTVTLETPEIDGSGYITLGSFNITALGFYTFQAAPGASLPASAGAGFLAALGIALPPKVRVTLTPNAGTYAADLHVAFR